MQQITNIVKIILSTLVPIGKSSFHREIFLSTKGKVLVTSTRWDKEEYIFDGLNICVGRRMYDAQRLRLKEYEATHDTKQAIAIQVGNLKRR